MVTRILAARSVSLLVLFILSHALLCSAQDLPGILMDLAPGYDRSPSSNPSNFTRSGPYVYFTPSENPDSTSDTRLWRTDGTLEGTRMVARSKNLVQPSLLTECNGTLFFRCNGLWKTNGTDAGTIKLSDVQPTQMAAVGSQLWVLVAKTNALELWKSNGTIAGTSMAFSIPTAATPIIRNLKGISNKLFFVMDDGSGIGRVAWCSNGTAEGTVKLSNAVTTINQTFTEFGGEVYFGAIWELWKTDGTVAGTTLLKTFPYEGTGTTMYLANYGGYLYIGTYDGLYRSDGTAAGTLPTITFESATPFPQNLTVFQDMLLFTARPQSNLCLMRTDGSQAGTSIILDFGYYNSIFSTGNFLVSMNRVYFSYTSVRVDIFVSDGAPGGTFSLPSMYSTGALLGDKMIGRGSGSEPWITDGTIQGTQLLKDICKSPAGLSGALKTSSQAVLSSAGQLRTKGTKATTDRITGAAFSPNPGGILEFGSQILFCGLHGSDYELYRMNIEGPAIAERVKDINPTGNSFPGPFLTANNVAWFRADDGVHGYELWKSDGTEAGTQMVRDVNPGSSTGTASSVNINGTVYFAGNDGVNGYDLWKSDGTEDGTQMVKNFTSSNTMGNLVVAGSKLFFGQSPNLCVSDGTGEGTSIIKTYTSPSFYKMTAYKNYLFFTPTSSGPLTYSDGTPAGTQSFGDYDNIGGIAVLGDNLLFCGGVNKNELFVSDGTVDGTQFLANIWFGSGAVANGLFYFASSDIEHGSEIWQTDGTPEGTHLAFDIYPGPASSSPSNLASCQGKLYFTAVDPFCGREIFVYPMEGLRESVTSYFDQGDTAARKIGNTSCTLDFVTNIEGGEVRVNSYSIDPPRYRGKALKKHWEVLGLYDQDFSVHLSFGYTPNELIAAGVTEEELRLLKSEDEGLSWTEVPCDVLADVNRVKTRHPQTSLSLWAIAGSKAAIPPSTWQAYK